MQTLDYSGKTVFISGAGNGMGKLAAENFSEAGANLVLADVDLDAIKAVKINLATPMLVLQCDVTIEKQVKRVLDAAKTEYGQIDVAINNAGVLQDPGRIADISEGEFQRNMDINALGVFLALKHELTLMKEQGHGTVLNMSSAAGVIGAPYMAAYAAAKHAVIGLTRTSALEYARYNIRVNALCPSYVDSPMVDEFTGESEAQLDKLRQAIPMRRLSSMQEIVNAMLWLCSDYNSYMTGQAISIDGGLTAA
jgi:NAD(P)-dependent dehydrogenase (short-subunit alcohol dehydrogenase family)